MKNVIKKCFTLAETLIVITILGVVAAISVPIINNQVSKTTAITKLKKTYAATNNAISEVLIVSQCSTIACALNANNISHNNSYNSGLLEARLKLFFPSIRNGNNYECFPRKTYSLNGLEMNTLGAHFNGENHYGYCLKDNIGITVWDRSFSTGIADCTGNSNDCARLYIYTGGKNKKAILGRNVFAVKITGKGKVTPGGGQCISNTTDTNMNYVNGSGCFSKLIKNNWKFNY